MQKRRRSTLGSSSPLVMAVFLAIIALALWTRGGVRAAEPAPAKASTPARTAVLSRSSSTKSVNATPVDWSGYRGIRRYSPYYYGYGPAYAAYPPFYFGHYAYRPWYARPYAYAWGYPGYAPPMYRYPTVGYGAYLPGYPYYPFAWGGNRIPLIAAPIAPAIAAPQVSSTEPTPASDDVGSFYW